jgi:hypothetical protein
MSHSTRIAIPFAALMASGMPISAALGQGADLPFASDYFIVTVAEGVVPTVLPSGLLSFTLEQGADQQAGGDQQAGAAEAEQFLTGMLSICGATAIEPVIDVPLEGAVLESACERRAAAVQDRHFAGHRHPALDEPFLALHHPCGRDVTRLVRRASPDLRSIDR